MKLSEEDEILLLEIQEGKIEAFEKARQKYMDYVAAAACSYTKCDHAAQDIIQESFLSFWLARKKIKIDGFNMQAYLYAIVRNKAIDKIRKDKRRSMAEGVFFKKASENSFNDPAVNNELGAIINTAIYSLRPKEQYVFKSTHMMGKRKKDISAELGIPVSTVDYNLGAAVKRIREIIVHHFQGQP